MRFFRQVQTHGVERRVQPLQGGGHVLPFVQPEQAEAKAHVVGRFVAGQRHTSGNLHTLRHKFFAVLNFGITGVAHHHARRLKAGRRHALDAALLQRSARCATQFDLRGLERGQAVAERLAHLVAYFRQGVGGHGGVIGMRAFFVGLHDLMPLFQVAGKAVARGRLQPLQSPLRQHGKAAAGLAAPAFLRCADQHVHAGGLHVHPHRTRGDAVEHEQTAHRMHRVGHGAQIVVGQHHAGGGFHMRGEHDGGLFAGDGGDHLGYGRGHEGRLGRIGHAAGLENRDFVRQMPGLDDLAPAITEPAVAHNEHLCALDELPRHGLHGKRAATRHDDCRLRVVGLFEHGRQITHNLLKLGRHVVERAVGVNHRILQQSIGIDIGQQGGHQKSPGLMVRKSRRGVYADRLKSLARSSVKRWALCLASVAGLQWAGCFRVANAR